MNTKLLIAIALTTGLAGCTHDKKKAETKTTTSATTAPSNDMAATTTTGDTSTLPMDQTDTSSDPMDGALIVEEFEETVTLAPPSPTQVRSAQAALNQSVDAGLATDGIVGPKTRQAIMDFQSKNNLSVTGRLDFPTVDALGLTSEFERAPASVD
ncbi:MAG: peptidoglycan-binding domain-containing protein [Pseudobdellovibrionaceae bacterium]